MFTERTLYTYLHKYLLTTQKIQFKILKLNLSIKESSGQLGVGQLVAYFAWNEDVAGSSPAT